MDAGDLAVFRAVARSGGITKAAQVLNTVQSNVTQRIRLLEDELELSPILGDGLMDQAAAVWA